MTQRDHEIKRLEDEMYGVRKEIETNKVRVKILEEKLKKLYTEEDKEFEAAKRRRVL